MDGAVLHDDADRGDRVAGVRSKWQGYGHPLPNRLRVYGPATEANVTAALALEWGIFAETIQRFARRLKNDPPAVRDDAKYRAALLALALSLEELAPAMRRCLRQGG